MEAKRYKRPNTAIGDRFGRLVVIGLSHDDKDKLLCECKCDCGNIIKTRSHNLVTGDTKSCGCFKIEETKRRNTTHGMNKTHEHLCWLAMKQRCDYEKHVSYHLYGGRGIRVCDRWRFSFENFLSDMGPAPSRNHTIERVDTDGDYCPENCKWATYKEQGQNTRTNVIVEYKGEKMTISQLADLVGMNYHTIHGRIRHRGMTPEEAVDTPVIRKRDYVKKHK